MAYTLQELTTPRTRQQIEAEIYASIKAKGVTPDNWKPSSVLRAIITGVAIVFAAFDRLNVAIAKGGNIGTAEGDWLTVLARDRYGIERIEGTRATGTVVLTNTGGGVYAGDPGDLVFANSSTGAGYRSVTPYSLPAFGVTEVAVEAVEVGRAGSAGAGEIDALETVLLGVTCTNPTTILGTDRETDRQLRERCDAKLGLLSLMGHRDRYLYVALSAKRADGSDIGVTRVKTIADGYGGVHVIVADADGSVTAPDVAIIHAELKAKAVPDGITVTTAAATIDRIDVAYELWVRDDHPLSNDELEILIKDELAAALGNLPIGGDRLPSDPPGSVGHVYRSALEGFIADAVGPQHLVRLDLTAPAADLGMASDGAPALGTATPLAIHRVKR